MSMVIIVFFIIIVVIVARTVSNVIINAMKDEVNQFQLGLARWIMPLLVSGLILIIVALVGSFIKFIAGLF